MATIALYIDDLANRITVKALLEAEGHTVDAPAETPDVAIADQPVRAIAVAQDLPVLLLTPMGQIPMAIDAMYKGVYGYIVLPLVPGETTIMVERAAAGESLRASETISAETQSLEEVESEHILATLRACKHNQAKAARLLGIGRNTLWRKLKKIRGNDDANT